jgi:peptidoglycan/xylan/chitin deacetylase (PgdA/CDA1 family)
MRTLKEAGANPITIDQLVDHLRDGAPLPEKAIVLTFDQGTLGLYENVWPIVKEYGWHATFFVHTGYVGRPSPTKEHVTWDQLRELQATGLIAVEPMTVRFPEFLGQLDDTALRREIVDSIEEVALEMGQRPKYFAYPYGNGDERVARALDEAGIVAAFNEVRAPVATPSDRLFLPRYAPKRLDEAMASWSRDPSPAMIGPLDIKPVTPADGLLTGWPQPGSDTEVILEGGRLPCFHTLLAGGVFQPLADAVELRAEGRPLIVGNQRQVAVVPYRRWMSAKGHVHSACDSLSLLVAPANFAVLGERLVPDGEAVRGPAVVVGEGLAWLADGTTMTVARRAAVELVGNGH